MLQRVAGYQSNTTGCAKGRALRACPTCVTCMRSAQATGACQGRRKQRTGMRELRPAVSTARCSPVPCMPMTTQPPAASASRDNWMTRCTLAAVVCG